MTLWRGAGWILVAVLMVALVRPARAGDPSADLLTTLADENSDQWIQTLERNRPAITEVFFNLCMTRCMALAHSDKLADAMRYARIADTADFVRRDESEWHVVGQSLLGRELIKDHKYDGAISVARQMLQFKTDGYDANMLLGVAYLQSGDPHDAVEPFRRAVRARPQSVEARLGLATSLARSGDIAAAMQQYHELLRIDPNNQQAEAALDTLNGQQTMGKMSRDPEAQQHFKRGEEFFKARKFPDAIEEYERAIDADNHFAKAYVYLGQSYMLKGEADHAIANYMRALELDPRDSQADFLLGDAFLYMYDQTHQRRFLLYAERYYKAALVLYPDYIAARDALSRVTMLKTREGSPP